MKNFFLILLGLFLIQTASSQIYWEFYTDNSYTQSTHIQGEHGDTDGSQFGIGSDSIYRIAFRLDDHQADLFKDYIWVYKINNDTNFTLQTEYLWYGMHTADTVFCDNFFCLVPGMNLVPGDSICYFIQDSNGEILQGAYGTYPGYTWADRIYLNILVTGNLTTTVYETSCNSYNHLGTIYFNDTLIIDTIATYYGNEIRSTHITIHNSVSYFDPQVSCDSYTLGIETYTETGIYFLEMDECDSLFLNLTIHNSEEVFITETWSESGIWNGESYTVSGNYTYITETLHGCDSIIHLNLIIDTVSGLNELNSNEVSIYPNPCKSEFINISGNSLKIIYNSNGQKIYEGYDSEINLPETGIYFLKFGKNLQHTEKIIRL